jgi:P-type conjugative transfer protein TrbJ
MNRLFRVTAATAALLALESPASAQQTVYDPQNYASNVIQAARALQQIDNQVRMLENQAQSLTNQARNLAQLPYTAVQTVQANLSVITGLLQQAQRLAYDVQSAQTLFSSSYTVSPTASQAALVTQANARWQTSADAYRQALLLQAGAVSGLPGAAQQTQALLGASQGASGVLQATQAGNQLLALQDQQLASLTALIATQGRASVLDEAGNAASRAQADAEFSRFIGPGTYQPTTVEMFH